MLQAQLSRHLKVGGRPLRLGRVVFASDCLPQHLLLLGEGGRFVDFVFLLEGLRTVHPQIGAELGLVLGSEVGLGDLLGGRVGRLGDGCLRRCLVNRLLTTA